MNMFNFATMMASDFLLPPQVVLVLGLVVFTFVTLLCKSDTRRVWYSRSCLKTLVSIDEVVGRDEIISGYK